jgi:serine/threonine protein kinase
MLLGQLPNNQMFADEKSTANSFELSDNENICFEDEQNSKTEFLSTSCKELLAQMMNEDPNSRITIDQILAHEWMTSDLDAEIAETVYLEMLARSDFISLNKS